VKSLPQRVPSATAAFLRMVMGGLWILCAGGVCVGGWGGHIEQEAVCVCVGVGWGITPVCEIAYLFTCRILLPGMKLFLGDHRVWYGQKEPPHGPNNPTYEPTATATTPPTHPSPTRPDHAGDRGSKRDFFIRTHSAWTRIYTGGKLF
jgi:hypothetical protein